MNKQNINTRVYAQKVELLLRLIPIVMEESVFAIHGGTERGEPEWDGYEFEYFKNYPSVRWKLFNLKKLADQNPLKLQAEADRLKKVLR